MCHSFLFIPDSSSSIINFSTFLISKCTTEYSQEEGAKVRIESLQSNRKLLKNINLEDNKKVLFLKKYLKILKVSLQSLKFFMQIHFCLSS